MLNVVAIRGLLSRPAEERVLPTSGDRIVGLEVTVRREGADRAESVPVAWWNPPASVLAWEPGEEVVVVGHVARRFFRAGGSTQSRTEVVASCVLPARQGKKVEAALADAAAEIDAALPSSLRAGR